MIQPQINSLVIARKFDYAIKLLKDNPQSYGSNNRLLYFLDYALVLHFAGRHEESIQAFEKAKDIYEQMYTVSLTKEGMTWLMNDNVAPYRGEDFERVLVNIFQAVNFAVQGDIEGALVEARNVDVQLSIINQQYAQGQKNVYQEDAFARFLMGIFYEAGGSRENFNDAYISYKKAVESYLGNYQENYKVPAPVILIENFLAVAEDFDKEVFEKYQRKFSDVRFVTLDEKQKRAEVYLIHYSGLSPVKHAVELPIPLPNGLITKLAFPAYEKRICTPLEGSLRALSTHGVEKSFLTLVGEDIVALALENLVNRKARVIAKAALRSAGKVLFEQRQAQNIDQGIGGDSGAWFTYVSSLYNIISEQPDLRSWQTLPAEIRISRLILEPGEYTIFFNKENLGSVQLTAGEKKFFAVRTNDY